MPFVKQKNRRNFSPVDIAERLGVSPAKVITWIRDGELRAINIANRGTTKPRFSISPEDLEAFENSRLVVPEDRPTRRRSSAATPSGKDYFAHI